VSGVADVAPGECVALYEHCRAGELEAAREVYRRLLPLARFDMTPKLVQYFKAAMDEVGLVGGTTRPPRLPLTDAELEEMRAAVGLLRAGVAA
jgi:4-hydroxy-tetrahydrodipicolinate synthase